MNPAGMDPAASAGPGSALSQGAFLASPGISQADHPGSGAGAGHASTCFGFEADFTAELRCIPMAVRRKLDLAGVKLKLLHWSELAVAERQRLLAWPDGPGPMGELRLWLLERTAHQSPGVARTLPMAAQESWQQQQATPPLVHQACRDQGVLLSDAAWAGLNELQRFALVKLSQSGHEHRNLPLALEEFGLTAL